MLVLRHAFAPRGMDAAFHQDELRSEDLVVLRTRYAGGLFDEIRTYGPPERSRWSKVRVVLAGHFHARTASGGVLLGPGDMVISRGWDDHRWRALDDRTDYLLVAWKQGTAAGDAPLHGGPLHLRGVDAASGPSLFARVLADVLERSSARERVLDATRAFVGALASFGLPLASDALHAVSASIEPVHHRFAHAMETTVFPLTSRPMAIDLSSSLDLGRRQTLRISNDFFRRFYVTAFGWRDYVRGMRLELGMFLSTHPRATTESVARALGFASPTALCHAFQRAGIPSPGEVRRRFTAAT